MKQYHQTSGQEPIHLEMWDKALFGIRKHLITHTREANLQFVAELPGGIAGHLSPKMDHLVCFLPGSIALGVTGGLTGTEAQWLPSWSPDKAQQMLLARELTKTCWACTRPQPPVLRLKLLGSKLTKMHCDRGQETVGSPPSRMQSLLGNMMGTKPIDGCNEYICRGQQPTRWHLFHFTACSHNPISLPCQAVARSHSRWLVSSGVAQFPCRLREVHSTETTLRSGGDA